MNTFVNGHIEGSAPPVRPEPALPATSARPSIERFLMAAEIIGKPLAGAACAIQGFGNVGGGDRISNAELLALDVDLLVPAALGNQITTDNVDSIRAHVIAEAANGPITPDADRAPHDGGVEIIPDILANAGGVIVSYSEWVQNKTSEPWPLRRVERRLADTLDDAASRVASAAVEHGCSRRPAAHMARTLSAAYSLRGIFPEEMQ